VTALVGSELLKARTTRTALGLALGLLALVALFVTVTTIVEDSSNAHPTRDALGTLGFVPLFALLFGILAVASEWRHGTVSQTFLVTPRRERVVAAKLVSSAIVGVALAVVAAVLALVIVAIGLPANGFDFDGGEAWRIAAEVVVAGALWGALGAALATVLPNQVGAIIGALAWLFVVESIISGIWPHVGQWLPGGAVNGLIHTGDGVHLSVGAAIVVTLGYVLLFAVAGIVLLRRRDITAS
jgi:ABC-type transport system involved in multi-copper enzyme maturation permease subunit